MERDGPVKHINFVLAHMYHLKYFMPLIIEANKQNIASNMYVFYKDENSMLMRKNSKNNPYNHLKYLEEVGRQYNFNFELRKLIDSDAIDGVTFFIERRGVDHLANNKKTYKVVLTCMLEFTSPNWYEWYVNIVDRVVFPSKFMATHYGAISSKNLYLGSPKYDVVLNQNDIRSKYNMGNGKHVMVLTPELETMDNANLSLLYSVLKDMGYTIVVKGRSKQPAPKNLMGDIYIEDECWFPHASMEIIEISDMAISFDSGVTKECVMMDTPFINIHVTKNWLPYEYFYKFDFCKNLEPNDKNNLVQAISQLSNKSFGNSFKECREKYLFEKGEVSKNILKALNV